MTASRLGVYNGSLRLCGERKLASLSENRGPRHLCDDAWNDGLVKRCLEKGQWTHATRDVRLDYDPSITTEFGFQYAFEKPDDYVNTVALSLDEYFDIPLNRFTDKNGIIYCDNPTIYLSYVSDDAQYGMDYSKWPETFNAYVQAELASVIILSLTQDKDRKVIVDQALKKAKAEAGISDIVKKPVQFQPHGTFVNSRMNGSHWRTNPNRA